MCKYLFNLDNNQITSLEIPTGNPLVIKLDDNLEGDFDLVNNIIKQSFEKNFIYTGCQILNKNLFNEYEVENFSVVKIWNELLIKQQLNGFESTNKFYHLTNLEIFKKLKGH